MSSVRIRDSDLSGWLFGIIAIVAAVLGGMWITASYVPLAVNRCYFGAALIAFSFGISVRCMPLKHRSSLAIFIIGFVVPTILVVGWFVKIA